MMISNFAAQIRNIKPPKTWRQGLIWYLPCMTFFPLLPMNSEEGAVGRKQTYSARKVRDLIWCGRKRHARVSKQVNEQMGFCCKPAWWNKQMGKVIKIIIIMGRKQLNCKVVNFSQRGRMFSRVVLLVQKLSLLTLNFTPWKLPFLGIVALSQEFSNSNFFVS